MWRYECRRCGHCSLLQSNSAKFGNNRSSSCIKCNSQMSTRNYKSWEVKSMNGHSTVAKEFTTLSDAGGRKEYNTGMQREDDENRGMPSLISPHMLTRLSKHMELGAKKYSEHNWMKGANYQRFIDSIYRHTIAFQKGDTTEDHLSAIIFNAMAMVHFDETGRANELDDRVDGTGKKIIGGK